MYQEIQYTFPGIVTAIIDKTHKLIMEIDNGTDISIIPYCTYQKYTFLHHLPAEKHKDYLDTGNGSIKTHKFILLPLEIQGIGLQL